jgi:hypothetical protein
LADIRQARPHLAQHVIIGVGGINSPEDVVVMLDAGADAVQAANVFFHDPLFGNKVHERLLKHQERLGQRATEHSEIALRNWLAAVEKLNLSSPADLAAAAACYFDWKDTYTRVAAARKAAVPHPDYFEQAILSRMPHRSAR